MIIEWDDEKNQRLQKERGLSFEDALEAIMDGRVLADLEHPDTERSHQRLMVLEIDQYVVTVPYVVDEDKMFLKTMFRDRKMQRKYR